MRPHWLIVGLIASVTLNLFLIGAAAGVFALGMNMAKQPPVARPGPIVWATQDLPQPDRRNVRRALVETRRDTLPDADRSLNLRADAWSALAQPQPDTAAIKQQLAQSRQIDIAIRAKVEDRLVDAVAALGAQNRSLFAAAMRRVLRPPAPAPQGPTNAATNAAP
jgi:uncharacterized membrane protein